MMSLLNMVTLSGAKNLSLSPFVSLRVIPAGAKPGAVGACPNLGFALSFLFPSPSLCVGLWRPRGVLNFGACHLLSRLL